MTDIYMLFGAGKNAHYETNLLGMFPTPEQVWEERARQKIKGEWPRLFVKVVSVGPNGTGDMNVIITS